MKKSRIILIAAILVCMALAVCLCACGSKDSTPSLLNFEGITFGDLSVEFDDAAHTIEVAGLPEGAEVAYTSNSATEVGVYHATATITKEGYNPLTLNATLTIRAKEFVNVSLDNSTIEYDGRAHSLTVVGAPAGTNVSYQNNGKSEVGTYDVSATLSKRGYNDKTLHATLKINVPSAATIVAARASANESAQKNYDFALNFSGTVNIAGFSGTANGNYEGKYRYNASTGEIRFARTTSGILLYDGSEYIVTQGDAKIKVNTNEDGEIKHIKVLDNDGEELMLVNKPFEAIVNALTAENLTNIRTVDNSTYKFAANITLTAENPLLAKVLSVIGRQGTSLSFKNVAFTNPVSGLVLYFNLDERMQLDTFAMHAEIGFPVKGVPVVLQVIYGQRASTSSVTLPSVDGLIIDKSAITSELNTIYGALDAVRDADDYSLDLVARNEFDPGWNVRATVDKYTACMYKHTYEVDSTPFVAFNHSYEFKTHHEEDGAETYKYTIGNITEDGSVYLVSRKGSNTITPLGATTVNTQFDYLTEGFRYTANDVDCIKKETKNGVVTYRIYLSNSETLAVNQKIADLINSNDAEGVIEVDNYFDSTDYLLKESCFTVIIDNGTLTNIEIETKLKYNPTDGEYTDKRITLSDKMTLEINKNLDKAQAYSAPKSTTTSLGHYGLNNAKFYIL